jgi:Transcriptional regulatory protein, C terminal
VPILMLSGRSDSTGKGRRARRRRGRLRHQAVRDGRADGARTDNAPTQHAIGSDSGGRVRRNPRRPRRQSGDGSRRGGPAIPTERHLLEVLARHPATLLSQQYLLTEVWGPGYETAQGNLRRYMAQLRRKLEPDPSRPQYFRTEPGMGYRFRPRFSQGPTGPGTSRSDTTRWPPLGERRADEPARASRCLLRAAGLGPCAGREAT